jgi:hypothetical protein
MSGGGGGFCYKQNLTFGANQSRNLKITVGGGGHAGSFGQDGYIGTLGGQVYGGDGGPTFIENQTLKNIGGFLVPDIIGVANGGEGGYYTGNDTNAGTSSGTNFVNFNTEAIYNKGNGGNREGPSTSGGECMINSTPVNYNSAYVSNNVITMTYGNTGSLENWFPGVSAGGKANSVNYGSMNENNTIGYEEANQTNRGRNDITFLRKPTSTYPNAGDISRVYGVGGGGAAGNNTTGPGGRFGNPGAPGAPGFAVVYYYM